jgi:hypothetical protein
MLTRYQHTDHLGSSCLETDETGVVISYEEYQSARLKEGN